MLKMHLLTRFYFINDLIPTLFVVPGWNVKTVVIHRRGSLETANKLALAAFFIEGPGETFRKRPE